MELEEVRALKARILKRIEAGEDDEDDVRLTPMLFPMFPGGKSADNFPIVIEDERQVLPDPSRVLERYLSKAAKETPPCPDPVYNDGKDSWECPSTGWVGPNAPISAKPPKEVAARIAQRFSQAEDARIVSWSNLAAQERERLARKAVKLKGVYLNIREVVDIMEKAPERSGNDLLFAIDLLEKCEVEVHNYLHALKLLLGMRS